MRGLILILPVLLSVIRCIAQTDTIETGTVTYIIDGIELSPAQSRMLFYNGKNGAKPAGSISKDETGLQNAFRILPAEANARNYYYWLLKEGYDLEAARFKERNNEYTFALTPHRRGFENIYAELGPRISANNNTGNIYGGGYGGFFRVSGTTRIWHFVSYLQQDNNSGRYKQGEYFSGLYTFFGKGWYLKPSLHYIYTGFTSGLHDSYPVSYIDSIENGNGRYTLYRTAATQDIDYTLKGRTHFLHIALPVTKRCYQWTFEASPSIQYIDSKSSRRYKYINNGTTDSFRNGNMLGTTTYSETGAGQLTDTVSTTIIGQAGGSIGYRFNLFRKPVFVRAGAWYLFGQNSESAVAWNAYALLQAGSKLWLHLSFTTKGGLPFALAGDGLYFNHYHSIKARPALSFQLFPLGHWSPLLTYQYEQQERYGDGAKLIYHALYFTLKYNL